MAEHEAVGCARAVQTSLAADRVLVAMTKMAAVKRIAAGDNALHR
jgi:hypothetical protein